MSRFFRIIDVGVTGAVENDKKDCTGVAESCPVDECTACSVRECPHRDPLHFHHDGCPSCWDTVSR